MGLTRGGVTPSASPGALTTPNPWTVSVWEIAGTTTRSRSGMQHPSWHRTEMRVARTDVGPAKHVEMNRSQVQVIALCHRMWDVAIVAAEWETTSQHTARSCVVYVTKETVEAAEAILLIVSGVHGLGEHAL